MDKIVPAFETSLLEPIFSSSFELAEIGIDSLLDSGLFRDIPIVSMIVGIGKTSQNLHDRNLLKQTLAFIKTFNEGHINEGKLNKYKTILENNTKKAEDELGRVLIILNRNVEIKKSQLLAKVFRAYVSEKIDWEQFCELSEVISRLFISDIQLLYKVFNNEIADTTQCFNYQADRLISIGLLDSAMKSMSIGNNNNSKTERFISINELVNLLCSLTM